MSGPVPVLGFPSKTVAIKTLKGRGLNEDVIARRLGMPSREVRRLAKLADRDWSNKRTVTFDKDTLVELAPHAAKRNISTNELVRRLVEIILDDNLLDGILDE